MTKKAKATVRKTMRRKKARGETIKDPGAYLHGTVRKIDKARAAKRKRTAKKRSPARGRGKSR